MKTLANVFSKFVKLHWVDHFGFITMIFVFSVLVWSYSVVGEGYYAPI